MLSRAGLGAGAKPPQALMAALTVITFGRTLRGGRTAAFDLRGLRASFENILTPVKSLDLSKDVEKAKDLRLFIEFHIQQLKHVGDELPATWVAVRKQLGKMADIRPYISLIEYMDICKNEKIPEREKAFFLSGFLHDLGVFLHFQHDPILKHWVILRNEWATNAVYSIMDDQKIKDKNCGHFVRDDIQRILSGNEYCEMHDEVLRLMMNFEICYVIPDEQPEKFIAPQLLPVEQRIYKWDAENNLQLRYTYAFMPKGLISRFIVRAHQYIKNNDLLWRNGVILEHNNTKAEIIETYGTRSISIRVSGMHKKELLTIVAEHFDLLNKGYEGIECDKMVPCNCKTCRGNNKPHFYTYFDLNRRRELNKRTVECPVSYDQVNVQGLLDDVFVTRSDVKSPLKVFISYSKYDKEYLERLKVFLSPLMREKNLIIWDDTSLIPGEDWDERIRYELFSADVIIFLVSPDLLATEYIWKTEMKEALNRHESGEARMIPILIRPCLWESSPFARYNIIPEKGKPLSTYQDKDEGWKIISGELLKSIEWQYNMIR